MNCYNVAHTATVNRIYSFEVWLKGIDSVHPMKVKEYEEMNCVCLKPPYNWCPTFLILDVSLVLSVPSLVLVNRVPHNGKESSSLPWFRSINKQQRWFWWVHKMKTHTLSEREETNGLHTCLVKTAENKQEKNAKHPFQRSMGRKWPALSSHRCDQEIRGQCEDSHAQLLKRHWITFTGRGKPKSKNSLKPELLSVFLINKKAYCQADGIKLVPVLVRFPVNVCSSCHMFSWMCYLSDCDVCYLG